LVNGSRRCLAKLATMSNSDQQLSRVELAAVVLGDSHALDTGTRLGAAVTRLLRWKFVEELHDDTDRTVWDRAGVSSDSVSAPALTWNLPVIASSPLAPLIQGATSLGVVVHLSQMALRTFPLDVGNDAVVLITENPRLVEAAAQRRSELCLISTNGNPSVAVRLLLKQLMTSGADLHYHGDFDAAGLAICRRMFEFGLQPWRMNVAHYQQAVADAAAAGVELPLDFADPGPTPWDDLLRDVFRASGRVVHEERLIDTLLFR
jgi:uncharacterized protein (TIGR02679 family)